MVGYWPTSIMVAGFAIISMLASVRFLLWGNTEMRTFTIAAIIAVLAVPAHAQTGHSKGGGKLGQKSDEQIAAEQQKKKNEENEYTDALKKIPDQTVKQKDPWGNMR
jgi:cytochrome bd-type quinol oxidase subunit 1